MKILKKQEVNNKGVVYIVDTLSTGLYSCCKEGSDFILKIVSDLELKELVENDNKNEYKFTKDAYKECKEYFDKLYGRYEKHSA